jgi:ABC-2 type transport system permease protein
MQGFQLIVNFLVMPMFFLSGALFPLQGLHGVINTLVRIDPLTYGVDGMRHLLLSQGRFNILLQIYGIGWP